MAVIKHRGDTIETKTVEAILIQPVFAVRQQEMQHLVLSVIEAERVPCLMFTPGTGMEILMIRTVETSESLCFIFHGMTMHDVHDHRQPHSMGIVDETLQLVGRAEA